MAKKATKRPASIVTKTGGKSGNMKNPFSRPTPKTRILLKPNN